ncbi:hypothetical protein [Congregibacter sp.]|uniref:hypothetical protein n=1 Tax=Congregibacter sp. TaxID=2744308 RepID=UPI003F6C0AD4
MEKTKLQLWLTDTHAALERYAGPLPFDVHLHLLRRDNAREPVPWANTRRNKQQALYFYVDPTFSQAAFRDDWTAAHEFSHLLLPYLGRSNAWFAEGFASYLQYQIMVEMNAITPSEARARREKKMRKAVAALESETLSLPENMPQLRERGSSQTFYWGGAVYFERVDAALARQGRGLQDALIDFIRCCRVDRPDLDALVSTLDSMLDTTVFTSELVTIRETPGIPLRP